MSEPGRGPLSASSWCLSHYIRKECPGCLHWVRGELDYHCDTIDCVAPNLKFVFDVRNKLLGVIYPDGTFQERRDISPLEEMFHEGDPVGIDGTGHPVKWTGSMIVGRAVSSLARGDVGYISLSI